MYSMILAFSKWVLNSIFIYIHSGFFNAQMGGFGSKLLCSAKGIVISIQVTLRFSADAVVISV